MTTDLNLASGVTLHALLTDKFKTGCFSINFLRPHNRQTAALDALLPSVLLRATEHYPDIRAISMHLDELYGASFGTIVRRKGEVKLTGFYADFIEDAFLPQGEHIFEKTAAFAKEVLLHPYTENGGFAERFVEGEKQNLINAIEGAVNDKRTYATQKMVRTMCENEAYGVPRLGEAEDVKKITAQRLWEHYLWVLEHSRVEIFYAGRQDAQTVAAAFADLLPQRNGSFETASTEVIPSAQTIRECSETMDVTQGKLVMGLRTGITASDNDFAALMLLNAVYGSGVTSKLFVNVREKMSVCYYASSSVDKNKGLMIISSGIDFADYDRAKDAILKELEDCKQGIISAEELESARTQTVSALRMAMDAPNRLDDFYIGMAIQPCEDIPELMRHIETLTADDLAAAARKLTLDTVYFLKGETA